MLVIHAPEPVVAIDFAVGRIRRLSHVRSSELPDMAGIQRSGIENQRGHFIPSPPVVILGVELHVLFAAMGRLLRWACIDARMDVKIVEPAVFPLEAKPSR